MQIHYSIVISICLLFSHSVQALTLSEILKRAEEVDPTFISSYENKVAAYANMPIAKSKLLPQVAFTGTTQKVRQDFDKPAARINKTDSVNAQINFRQAVYKKRDWIGLSIAELQAELGDAKFESSRIEVWQRIISLWIDLKVADANRQQTSESLKNVATIYEQELKRYSAGESTKDKVDEMIAQLSLSKAQHLEVEENFKSSLNNFQRTLKFDYKQVHRDTFLSKFGGGRLLGVIDLDRIKKNISDSPEIVAAKINAQISDLRLAQSTSDHSPTVDLVGSYSHLQNDTVSTTGAKYNVSQFGIQITVPIFSGGGVNASEYQAAASSRAAKSDLDAAILRITNQLDSDWSQLLALKSKVNAYSLLINASKSQKISNQLALKAGIKSLGDLASSEVQLSKRVIDLNSLLGQTLKQSVKLMSALPVSEEIWGVWLNEVDR
jgi:outer membrane protein TolC